MKDKYIQKTLSTKFLAVHHVPQIRMLANIKLEGQIHKFSTLFIRKRHEFNKTKNNGLLKVLKFWKKEYLQVSKSRRTLCEVNQKNSHYNACASRRAFFGIIIKILKKLPLLHVS